MKFIETELKGAFIVEPERLKDERGFFARTWCKKEFEQHGAHCGSGSMQHFLQSAEGNLARHAFSDSSP